MILHAVQTAFDTQVLQSSLLRSSRDSIVCSGSGSSDSAQATLNLFKKMQLHCNFLKDLDSLGDMNNSEKLREVIQNEAYIFAISSEKAKEELKQAKS